MSSSPQRSTSPGPAQRGVALVDAWYAQALASPDAVALDDAISSRFSVPWVRLSQRRSWLRGVLWFAVSRETERIVCPFSARGFWVCLALHRLLSRRAPQVYLVEFLRGEPRGLLSRFKEAVHVLLFAHLLRPVLAGAQVMTRWECEAYARKYRLPLERFTFIAFPMVRHPTEALGERANPACMVLSSGRAACDWPTLMSAAKGAAWPLTIVCSAEDRESVNALNHDNRARVLSEISHEEHQQLLEGAAVYALVLREQRASSGQVRLARAIEAGVPVVASSVLGLDGYIEDGTTALAVPVADAAALRSAIDSLLHGSALREDLRRKAHAAMRSRSLDAYVEQVRAFALGNTATTR